MDFEFYNSDYSGDNYFCTSKFFHRLHGKPFVKFNFDGIFKEKDQETLPKKLAKLGFELLKFETRSQYIAPQGLFYHKGLDVLFDICHRSSEMIYLDNPSKEVNRLLGKLIKMYSKLPFKTGQRDNFYLINQTSAGFDTIEVKTKPLNIPDNRFDLFYGKKFPLDKIRGFFSSTNGNLMLLHGVPGTGKTNLIRHLVGETDKKVLYVPPNMAGMISNPSFISFLVKEEGAILLIEDAEEILSKERNSATNNLLQCCDGFLKDALDLRVICTFNKELDDIDPALRRKGRLYFEYKFSPLKQEEAIDLLKFLGKSYDHVTQNMVLADLFNLEDNVAYKEEKRKIGFGP